ncbi:putative Bacterial surface antigen (D15) [Vibrio nigripulchritudo SFn118]|nr:putative Bacterial surface antigen (D15) [Vibrio nigripulchritudo SFn118]
MRKRLYIALSDMKKIQVSRLIGCGLLTIGMPALAFDLEIEGLKGELDTNVSAYLSAIDPSEYSTSLRFQSRLEDNIIKALKALGHYQPDISFVAAEDGQSLTVNVDPGPLVTIRISDLVISGEAATDPDFIKLREGSKLGVGDPLNHANYEAYKSSLRNLALRKGYFDGEFGQTKLEVAPEHKQAFVTIEFDSGQRYYFGDVQIFGSQIRESRVKSLVPFEAGEPYLASKIGELNQSLSNTEWFSSVHVEPELSYIGKQRELPMNINLAPQSENQIETGLGYSTDIGFRGKLSWKKPWLNDRGHSLHSSLSLSLPEQAITASYKIPLEDVLREYYEIQYGMKRTDKDETKSLEHNLAVKRHWKLDSGWQRTASIRFLYDDSEERGESRISKFVLPGFTFSRARVRGGAMPMWGDKHLLTVEAGNESLLSDTGILRLQGRTAIVRSIGENHRGLARFDAGGVFAGDFDKVPRSLRFFAGGDNSIRGYGYEDIPATQPEDKFSGGKYLAVSSLEYQFRVYGNWWLATFVDYGDAWTDKPDWKTGVGVGVRWASPVGPIRLDFAKGLNQESGDQFKIHFTLGPEL